MIRCNCGKDPGEGYSSFGHSESCPRGMSQRITKLEIEREALKTLVFGAANYMRGMALDPRVQAEQKEALISKAAEIDVLVEKHLD